MNAMWISLKQNMNCGSKYSDVARLPDKMVRRKSSSFLETELNNADMNHQEENPFIQPILRDYYFRNRFHELQVGDPSRNVVEMIFRASAKNPAKSCSRKIKRVLKVNNSPQDLAKFEKYRETVMIPSHNEQQILRHPRNMVDGNELLQFYGTTMTCCSTMSKTLTISSFCRDPNCRVCRIIQSGFNTPYNKKYGIRLNTNSKEMSEDVMTTSVKRGCKRNGKKAIIICRTIAGTTVGMESEEGDYESVGYYGVCRKPGSLIIWKPTAVLPCFVVILD